MEKQIKNFPDYYIHSDGVGCSKAAIQRLANGQTTHFKNGVLA